MLNGEPITTTARKAMRYKDKHTSERVYGYQIFHSSVTFIVAVRGFLGDTVQLYK